jgi:hypothetical protein
MYLFSLLSLYVQLGLHYHLEVMFSFWSMTLIFQSLMVPRNQTLHGSST